MSFIQTYKKQDHTPKCVRCGKDAQCINHITPFIDGGDDSDANKEPLCFYHHHEYHAGRGDWQRWGQKGGQKTASNPWNLRNLKQFKNWTDQQFDEWCFKRIGGWAGDWA